MKYLKLFEEHSDEIELIDDPEYLTDMLKYVNIGFRCPNEREIQDECDDA